MTIFVKLAEQVAKNILEHVGKTIVMAVPLGIGKPIAVINALYRMALADSSIQLTIITGLTLARPVLRTDLERRLVEPMLDRLLENYEDPLYEAARVAQTLPSNIQVIEFYLSPGKYLHNAYVQQHYISSNYSAVIQDLAAFPINVVATQVAPSDQDANVFSLSCNSDLFQATAELLKKLKAQGKTIAIVAEINANLPFMLGAAVVNAAEFTDIVDSQPYPALFPIVREEISARDHLIGLYTSTLIPDAGCLQVGIGKLSNALANALIMRHESNVAYLEVLQQLKVNEKFGQTIAAVGALEPFQTGLYASTEMFSDEYMQLYSSGVLKKRVYDDMELQKLLNAGVLSEYVDETTLSVLTEHGLIHSILTPDDILFLKRYGVISSDTGGQDGRLNQSVLLGNRLLGGKIIHAGFYLGSTDFYQQLRNLSDAERVLFDMTTIARTNSLFWSPELLRLQRTHARFVNTTMMVSLTGSVVSDGLSDAQEVSGVGGQFDFIHMAQQLEGAHSIMNCASVRESRSGLVSNLVWEYPNMTAPRFFRDIVVTEYGIADCRHQTDSEVIKRLLNVADSRFQPALLKQAKKAGKIESDYVIPDIYCHNLPSVIEPIMQAFKARSYFQAYPFGSDVTPEEDQIIKGLLCLKNMPVYRIFLGVIMTLFKRNKLAPGVAKRMQLEHPKSIKEFLMKLILRFVLI